MGPGAQAVYVYSVLFVYIVRANSNKVVFTLWRFMRCQRSRDRHTGTQRARVLSRRKQDPSR
jgi:hypothetical protein